MGGKNGEKYLKLIFNIYRPLPSLIISRYTPGRCLPLITEFPAGLPVILEDLVPGLLLAPSLSLPFRMPHGHLQCPGEF